MSSPLSSAVMADLLDPRFREVFMGKFEAQPDMVGEIYTIKTSDRDTERVTGLTPMGDLVELTTGTLSYDGQDQAYDVTATHRQWALGIMIQRDLYDDSQFDVIDGLFEGLADAVHKTRQKHGFRIMNSMADIDTFFYNHTEGVALCSNSHTTTRSGVSTATGFDNLTTASLSATSLTAAITQFRQLKDLAGETIDETPDELWFPVNMIDTVAEILETQTGLFADEGTKNVHFGRLKPKVSKYLTDSNDWSIQNSAMRKKATRWYERIPVETAKMEAFDQFNAKARVYTRYSYLWSIWQWIVGASVT